MTERGTMTPTARHLIRRKREGLGLSTEQASRLLGLSEPEYADLERHDDELRTVLPMRDARRLAQLLGVDLFALFDARSEQAGDGGNDSPSRCRVLSDARKRLGATTRMMADDIGFEERFVLALENRSNALEDYPFAVWEIVANYLGVSTLRLIDAVESHD